jgi:hypothetical protein
MGRLTRTHGDRCGVAAGGLEPKPKTRFQRLSFRVGLVFSIPDGVRDAGRGLLARWDQSCPRPLPGSVALLCIPQVARYLQVHPKLG